MKMVKLLIQVPERVKADLDALRTQGYTMSGYIRDLVQQDLKERHKVGLMPHKRTRK